LEKMKSGSNPPGLKPDYWALVMTLENFFR
jgi:hypothetical protein